MNHDHRYALVAWLHPSASMVKYSFEDENLTRATYGSYSNQKPTPRIVGVRDYDSLRY